MSAFAAAINVLFADPNLGRDALHHVGTSGEGTPVRVILSAPDQVTEFNGGRFVTDSVWLDVRVSEVASPAKQDRFIVGAETLIVISDPIRDTERLVWKCECRRAV